MPRKSLALLLGPVVVVGAWIVILSSWWLNRGWFIYTRHAFSDLGGPRSCCPGLYNYGLIILGAFLAIYGLGIAYCSRGKLGSIGGGYLAVAGIFLSLIGLFPAGTRHHVCVSTWFFIQSYIALALVLAEKASSRLARASLAALLCSILLGVVIAIWPGWPSAATLETYLILFLDEAILAATLVYLRSCNNA